MILDGIRVADFSRYLSGPSAAMLLADLGADVIKIESYPDGDPSRESGPFQGAESVYFMSSNRNKRSIVVNMRDARGVELARGISFNSDVVIQNFKPGLMAKLGLDYETLRVQHPRLIYLSVSGFGSSGPGKNLPGFDQSAQAMSGLMSVTGTPDTGPLRVGIAVADTTAGVVGAFGVLAALLKRERTGEGSLVETSLFQSVVWLLNYQAQKYLSLGEVPGQDGNDHPLMFPQGTFATADRPITIATGNNDMWGKLCEVLGCIELAKHPDFATNEDRMRNRVRLRELIEERLRERPAVDWIRAVNEAGIPATQILTVGEALSSPIAQHLGMVGSIAHPSLGDLDLLGMPMSVGAVDDGWLRRPPPKLGEHSVEICQEMGLTRDEINDLITANIVVQS